MKGFVKGCKLVLVALGILCAQAALAATRSIPKGEEHPSVIEKVFASPFGEVEFTHHALTGHSAFLRNVRGHLLGYQYVLGPASC